MPACRRLGQRQPHTGGGVRLLNSPCYLTARPCFLLCQLAGVEDNGSLTRVAAFPIGIDPDRFTEALEMPEVKANIAQLLNR